MQIVLFQRDLDSNFSQNTAFRHNYRFFAQRVTKLMACTTYLITTRCSYSWNKRWGHIIYLVARNQIIFKRRTIYIVNGGYYFLIQIISSLLILESPKFSLGMTLPFSRAEKPAQGWNSLCHMNLAMLQDRPFFMYGNPNGLTFKK